MFDRLYPHSWMALPANVKTVLIDKFKLKKTGVSEIFNEEVKSDGYTLDDLKAINPESMAKFLGVADAGTFVDAWHATLDRIENKKVETPVTEKEDNAKKSK